VVLLLLLLVVLTVQHLLLLLVALLLLLCHLPRVELHHHHPQSTQPLLHLVLLERAECLEESNTLAEAGSSGHRYHLLALLAPLWLLLLLLHLKKH
jgi:hypothetical protein